MNNDLGLTATPEALALILKYCMCFRLIGLYRSPYGAPFAEITDGAPQAPRISIH